METFPCPLRFYVQEAWREAGSDSGVVVYYPNGLGDFVHLSYLIPFLPPETRYYLLHPWDAFTALFEDGDGFRPLYSGTDYQTQWGLQGVCSREGGVQYVYLPAAVRKLADRGEVEAFTYCAPDEIRGYHGWPFNTKARYMTNRFLSPETRHRLAEQPEWRRPLRAVLPWGKENYVTRYVTARLESVLGVGERRLLLLSRAGHSFPQKNWGHLWREEHPSRREGEEARDFVRLWQSSNPGWVILSMEGSLFPDGSEHSLHDPDLRCYSYARVFAEGRAFALPVAQVTRRLVELASLSVGVSTGPYHLSVAREGLATVGIWPMMHPSWYDDPTPTGVHVLGRFLHESNCYDRPGTFDRNSEVEYDCLHSPSRTISGELAVEAATLALQKATLPPVSGREPRRQPLLSLPAGCELSLFAGGRVLGRLCAEVGEALGWILGGSPAEEAAVHHRRREVSASDCAEWPFCWINGFGGVRVEPELARMLGPELVYWRREEGPDCGENRTVERPSRASAVTQ